MKVLAFCLLLLALTPLPARALTICSGSCPTQGGPPSGVIDFDFTLAIDVGPGADLTVNSGGDVYIAVPNDLFASVVTLAAMDMIILDAQLTADVLNLCSVPDCDFQIDHPGDVYVQAFDPIGDLSVTAGGSILISPIVLAFAPEPRVAVLLGLGLVAALRRWRHAC